MSYDSLKDAELITFGDTAQFWDKLRERSSNQNVGFFRGATSNGNDIFVIGMHHSVQMVPFVRKQEELFSQTAKMASATHGLKVVINGPTYGLTNWGLVDVMSGNDPVSPENTLQEGKIVYKNAVIAGRSSNMFYIKNTKAGSPPYRFGRGEAPTKSDAAIGNLGPLVIDKLPYGSMNLYSPPKPYAKTKGEPRDENAASLIQRSNLRFNAMSKLAAQTGKVSLGYRKDKAQLIILLQPHGKGGISITQLRDLYIKLGIDSAVYLDGSDSVMLMIEGRMLVSQGSNKNETCISGIGFRY